MDEHASQVARVESDGPQQTYETHSHTRLMPCLVIQFAGVMISSGRETEKHSGRWRWQSVWTGRNKASELPRERTGHRRSSGKDTGNCWHGLLLFKEFPSSLSDTSTWPLSRPVNSLFSTPWRVHHSAKRMNASRFPVNNSPDSASLFRPTPV